MKIKINKKLKKKEVWQLGDVTLIINGDIKQDED